MKRIWDRARSATAQALAVLALMLTAAGAGQAQAPAPRPRAHSVILFIADGLRHDAVNATDAPTLLALRRHGVELLNSHAVFPTLTTPNAAAIATGHLPGDTGDFSNAQAIGFAIFADGRFGRSAGSPVPFLENDLVLADLDAHFHGNFLHETSLLAVARAHGFNTAAIGKLGPTAIQDVSQLAPGAGGFATPTTVILDDSTAPSRGVPIPAAIQSALTAAGLPLAAPRRIQPAGDVSSPGTRAPNREQQQWFVDAATRAVLPVFAASGRPFVLVFWSRDPDGTQHDQGDSLNTLQPGINGPTSRAAVANADANLKQILDYLDRHPMLKATTDVLVTSDHGFATISKHQIDAQGHVTHSYSTRFIYHGRNGEPDVKPGWLPPGFLAIDLAHELGQPLYDPDTVLHGGSTVRYMPVDPRQPASEHSLQHPRMGSALIGGTGELKEAQVIVAANGGSDLIYIPDHDRSRARRVVQILERQDYIDGLFADVSVTGPMPGTVPLSFIGLAGSAVMPRPTLVVSFRSFLQRPGQLLSAVQIADTPLQEGQGMHGSLSRDNTFNNMEAIGPDFRKGYVDRLPAGNMDIAPTLAHILGLELPAGGALRGRVLTEALAGTHERMPRMSRHTLVSTVPGSGQRMLLHYQELAGHRYLDAVERVPVRR